MKIIVKFVTLLAFFSALVAKAEDSHSNLKNYQQSISFYGSPLLGLAANYDRTISPHSSIQWELSYGFFGRAEDTWTSSIAYRYYPDTALRGFFTGVYLRAGEYHQKFTSTISGEKMSYRLVGPFLQTGIDFLGYRIHNQSGLATVLKLGYGVKVVSDMQWENRPDAEKTALYEGLMGLNVELSTGFSF